MATWTPVIFDLRDEPVVLKKKKGGAWKPDANSRYSIVKHGYKLDKTIGNGLFSKIKLAYCEKTNKKVAIKIIYKNKLRPEVQDEYLDAEVAIMQNLEHPGMIELYEAAESVNNLYLVMELAENGDLLDYILKHGYLSEEEARRIFRQILDVVKYCHDNYICHRDIKCENVLLDEELNVKLTDFGFSCPTSEGDLLTQRCGSYAYAAPEILDGDPYEGFKTDIWSMGVTLYAMLCGKLPFHEEDIDILRISMNDRIHFTRHISKDAKTLIRAMLCPNPKKRITLEEICHSSWLSKPMGVSGAGAPLASHVSLHSVESRPSVELNPNAEHGYSCDQHNVEIKPKVVTKVLRSVALKHSTGESKVDLRSWSLPGMGATLGITGQGAKKILEDLHKVPEFQVILNRQADIHHLPKTKVIAGPLRKGSLGATILRRLSCHKGLSSSSVINLPQDRLMASVTKLREDQVSKELRSVHYSFASKAAVCAGKQKKRAVLANYANNMVAETYRMHTAPEISKREKEELQHLRSMFAAMTRHREE
ncbi:testis-specific serine/threonine-protein kinase 1 [Lingula anatina]|uniref:non-specific serine/threonine protein kinase n=1 Tax=Lingula anatina TaxID=7574 RepID=A0A1S3IAJ4_LINAN|nr:testis-specific serine/threonine-protein kinase 1 [Lingula anatina]|eukprot:XP_013394429.1 testis-specific serine/threonine-protein kinase 1 [Lingula anatina]